MPSSAVSARFDNVNDYTDLPSITCDQVQHFFEHYKDLEPGKWVKIIRWGDADEARKFIEEAVERSNSRQAA